MKRVKGKKLEPEEIMQKPIKRRTLLEKGLKVGAALGFGGVLSVLVSSCGSSTPTFENGNNSGNGNNSNDNVTDSKKALALAAINNYISNVQRMAPENFDDAWKDRFAEIIKDKVTKENYSDSEFAILILVEVNTPEAKEKFYQLANLGAVLNYLSVDNVCRIELYKDGTNPPTYNASAGVIEFHYSGVDNTTKRTLGESLEAFIRERGNADYTPLKTEVKEALYMDFGNRLDPWLSGGGILDKNEAYPLIRNTLELLRNPIGQ